ncbi:MAG: cyclic nucleotide-binding domain-containing protein [bacterium]|nr:cyclic nucleotide-binding domain-containing protein [bacterium]
MENSEQNQFRPAWLTGAGYQDTDFGRLLQGFSNYERESFLQLGREVEYPMHSLVVEEGLPANNFFVILDGSVEIWSHDVQVLYTILKRGAVFGELSFFSSSRVATVRTQSDSDCLVFDRERVLDWFRRREERLFKLFVFNITRIIIAKLRGANDRIRDLETRLREGN